MLCWKYLLPNFRQQPSHTLIWLWWINTQKTFSFHFFIWPLRKGWHSQSGAVLVWIDRLIAVSSFWGVFKWCNVLFISSPYTFSSCVKSAFHSDCLWAAAVYRLWDTELGNCCETRQQTVIISASIVAQFSMRKVLHCGNTADRENQLNRVSALTDQFYYKVLRKRLLWTQTESNSICWC